MAKVCQDVMTIDCLRNKNYKVIVDSEGITRIWKNYIEKLPNEENILYQNMDSDAKEGPACIIAKEEVIRALSKMRYGKA